jgi:hypothetical protein
LKIVNLKIVKKKIVKKKIAKKAPRNWDEMHLGRVARRSALIRDKVFWGWFY